MELTLEQKRNRLFIILSGIFITNALLAEIIGVKIFSAEATVGLPPSHLKILGFEMDFNLTAGALIWPVVFIATDLINEYFGKPGVKRISYLTALLILYSFVVIFMAIRLPPADWWAQITDINGNVFNMDLAFNKVLGQGLRIILGSLAAFLLGQLVDVFVFQKLRLLTGNKGCGYALPVLPWYHSWWIVSLCSLLRFTECFPMSRSSPLASPITSISSL